MQERFKFITESLKAQKELCACLSAVKSGRLPAAVTGVSHIHRVLLCLGLIGSGQKPFIVVPGESEAERTAEDLESLGVSCVYFPARDYTFRNDVSRSHEYEHKRLGALSRLLGGEYDACITTAEAAIGLTVPPDVLAARQFSINSGDTVCIESLALKLLSGGYVRSDQVDGAGQFSVRGSILDFFTPDRDKPCRVDFFGDEIDSISVFDPDTQRRIDCVKTVNVSPVSEFNPESLELFAERLKKLSSQKKITPLQKKTADDDIVRLENGLAVAFEKYTGIIFEKSADVFGYMPDNGIICLFDTNGVYSSIDGCLKLHSEEIKSLLDEGILPPGFKPPYGDTYVFNSVLKDRGAVFCDSFPKSFYEVEPKELIGLNLRQSSGYSGSVASLCEDIKAAGKLTVVLAGTERAASNLCEDLCRDGIGAKFCSEPARVGTEGVFVTVGQLTSGFELPGAGLTVVVYGTGTVRPAKRRYKKGNTIGSLEELQKGDHVVHATHGIGIFDGVEQIKSHGIVRDYIRIAYAGRDVLYVPVTSLELVSRYVGAGGEDETNVKINRLGSKEWSNTRARVRKAVKDMAKQLTALYAKRMQTKGFAFSPDGDLQSDFESRFEFEETEDQLKCVSEIKRDMERAVPMDRLLCGDVGFGKTEVALRAAFKCIADGKQCAILVPTTILCWQHFRTAAERFGGMAVNVEMLSRFRTAKQQTKIKKDLRAGNIDLIIGTHSLIAKDVVFKDLGLIIVDEEQRFGVAQKERLKELFPGVDALTLSATPIPRTLNMALSGLRDMSSIEEAPLNRRPVQTYVLEQDTAVINEAISRELRRGGQVYYLHNRTESIDACAVRIKQSHPDANVAVAHGKMDEAELSKVWQKLLEREIDILVCTTIIETGVDVPNVNTLIIENADMMGLAQLHQIRGRVGRSHRTAYAYLFFTAGKALSEVSQKRLDAIRRFTEFGSGFRIAMRDLEIRGAGNILGGEQHGHMEAVGYDMYLKMLNDAIAEEKGEKPTEHKECLVDIRISAHIPEDYISSLPQRLSAYRRIADIRSEDDMFDVTDELLDRYGDLPLPVDRLIKVSYYKNVASGLGFSEIGEQDGSLLLYCDGLTEPAVKLVTSPIKKRVMFSAGHRPYLTVKPQNGQKVLDLWAEVLGIMTENERKA